MTHLRRALGPVAAVWLSCQIAAVASEPLVAWLTSAEQPSDCTCAHGDHAICPMHHKQVPGSKNCLIRSANGNAATVFASLLGGVGLVAATNPLFGPGPSHTVAVLETTTIPTRSTTPDPPPPRA